MFQTVEDSESSDGVLLMWVVLFPDRVGCNQRFLDIQKQMSDRILAAQAESERIVAQCTPQLTRGEKSGQRNVHSEAIVKSGIHVSAHDGSRQECDNGSAPPGEVMSLTVNSPSLMLLKNLVKENEKRSPLGNEEATQTHELAARDAMDASAEVRSGEDGESDWTDKRLCSKGWLPIILEEEERIAQSVEGSKSATPQGSGTKDHSEIWTEVCNMTFLMNKTVGLCVVGQVVGA
jgi:hypothetical protein